MAPQAGSMVRRELVASPAVSTGNWSRSWGFCEEHEAERMRGLAAVRQLRDRLLLLGRITICLHRAAICKSTQWAELELELKQKPESCRLAWRLTCFFSCSLMTTKDPSQAEEALPRRLNPGGDVMAGCLSVEWGKRGEACLTLVVQLRYHQPSSTAGFCDYLDYAKKPENVELILEYTVNNICLYSPLRG